MHRGYIAVSPYDKHCAFCDYKCICDYGDVFTYEPRQVKGKVDAQVITNIVTKGGKR
jgi:ATP-dependent helicase/DNAse subunit B